MPIHTIMSDIQQYSHRITKTTVEAAQLSGLNASALASWANGHQIPHMHTQDTNNTTPTLHIYGHKAMLVARTGDWIIKHPETGFEVLPQNDFRLTYTP